MLSLTRKADYAIVALSDLARQGASRASARAISERTRVPLPMLTNILHQLLGNGLVTSAMGAKGGYALSRPPRTISLAEMIDAIEGTFKLTVCCGDADQGMDMCELQEGCRVVEPLRRIHARLRGFLGEITLAEIAFYSAPIRLNVSTGGLHVNDRSAEAVG
ncbi:MAG: Rrf2 family transcriptional regulator [Planctomycetes bacterium]|nr:Rrf2 family transcriptional regulator [Planctomycetota bacterium]